MYNFHKRYILFLSIIVFCVSHLHIASKTGRDNELERNIAILGWGSLINSPRNLEIKGKFKKLNLNFPIELSTVSFLNTPMQKLTRIIDKHWGHPLTLWFVEASTRSLSKAIANLAAREYTSNDNIFYVKTLFEGEQCNATERLLHQRDMPLVDKKNRLWCISKAASERLPYANILKVIEWATTNHYDAVIWTGLGMVHEYDRKELIALLKKDRRTLKNTKEYILTYSPDLTELTQFEKNILANDL